jgi:hypothetical protein
MDYTSFYLLRTIGFLSRTSLTTPPRRARTAPFLATIYLTITVGLNRTLDPCSF